jgi:hypothetical protein
MAAENLLMAVEGLRIAQADLQRYNKIKPTEVDSPASTNLDHGSRLVKAPHSDNIWAKSSVVDTVEGAQEAEDKAKEEVKIAEEVVAKANEAVYKASADQAKAKKAVDKAEDKKAAKEAKAKEAVDKAEDKKAAKEAKAKEAVDKAEDKNAAKEAKALEAVDKAEDNKAAVTEWEEAISGWMLAVRQLRSARDERRIAAEDKIAHLQRYDKIKLADEDSPASTKLYHGLRWVVVSAAAADVPHSINIWAKLSVVDKVEEGAQEAVDKAKEEVTIARWWRKQQRR